MAYSFTTPCFETFLISSQVRVNDLRNDILPQLALKTLQIERGVNGLHEPLHLRALVLIKPRTNCLCDRAYGGHNRVFRLVKLLTELPELAEERVRLFHPVPAFLSWRVFVQNHGLSCFRVGLHSRASARHALLACLCQTQLSPAPAGFFLLKARMFCTSTVIQSVDDGFRKGFVGLCLANRLGGLFNG